MNKDRQDSKLHLPSPRSPHELDEKILSHARANAPAGSRSSYLGWAGGLATTAVLVVAVYLSQLTDPGRDQVAPATREVVKEEAFAGAEAAPAKTRHALSAKRSAADATEAAAPAEEAQQAAAARTLQADQALPVEPDPEKARQVLKRLQALVEQGKTEQARQEYSELRANCTECGLPETLEQALASRPQQTLPQR